MARVLVTGGAGFIGSHLVHALCERGDQVRTFDNFSTGTRANLASVSGQVEVIEGDLRSRVDLARALDGVEILFHQAAYVSLPGSIEHPDQCFATNVQGVIDLLAAAHKAGVKRAVLASSAAVYGASTAFPLNEEEPTQSLSPYAVSKKFNEQMARLYTQTYGLPTTTLRYFNVYGPRQSPESDYAAVIPNFLNALCSGQSPTVFGDGKQTRDFVYVEDVVRANLLASENKAAAGQSLNVCSGKETSLLDLLAALRLIFPDGPEPVFVEPRAGDVIRSVGDPALAAEELGFRAQVSLEEGLRRTAEAVIA